MSVETTDYQTVLGFIREVIAGEARPPAHEAPAGLRDKQPQGGWIDALGLGLEAAVAKPTSPERRLAQFQVFAAGWPEIEGVMILQRETGTPADVRVALTAKNERALRDLLRAFPSGKVGHFLVAADWMLAALSEFFEGEPLSGGEGPHSFERSHCFLGLKRGTGPFSNSPTPDLQGHAGRELDRGSRQRANTPAGMSGSKDPVLAQLRALAQTAGRRERSQFMVEGERLVHRAIADGLPVEMIAFTPELERTMGGGAVLRDAQERHIRHFRISDGLMGKITSTRPVPPAVAAVFTLFRDAGEFRTGPETTLLVTEAVNNPENLGMVLRTADAVGADGVVVLGNKSDPFHKLCVRAARGAVGRVPILSCADPLAYLRRLRGEGFRILGATARAEVSLYDREMKSPIVVVVGNEQEGITPALLEACTERVQIPMAPGQSSLNVGVAAGVLLYELLRQRRARTRLTIPDPAPSEPVQF